MPDNELRTLTAAIILSGLFANRDATRRDVEVQEAVLSADTLLEALNDLAPLQQRIRDYCEKRRTSVTPKDKPSTGWYPKDRYQRTS
ncbi:MAG: hypothetical protein LBH43_20790 [Treponema sp.]|jgi:hypothetical protein|nr:hypothetical protein [Treponema sp.]